VKSVTDAKLGDYLTGPNGLTLYVFTKDTGGTSACTGACATSWPPFVLSSGATAQAGTGVTGTFATITRADGTTQVTYMGAPLYYFAKDRYAGDVTGQGVGGVWFVAATAGGPGGGSTVTPPPPSATAASSAAGSSSSVDVFDYGFGPATLTVAVGTTVTWTKSGSAPHTVTSDDGAFPGATLTAGQPYAFTFTKAGTYAYHCAIHASMTGTVVVK
jgi:predicted lipoprotein with Yx(FWY)xxD motif/plastocyanin